MMTAKRVALIVNGMVINTIVADLNTYKLHDETLAVESDTANIGDAYSTGKFISAPVNRLTTTQLTSYANSMPKTLFNTVRNYNLSTTSLKIDATQETRADIASLARWGLKNPTAIKSWLANDGSVVAATGADYIVAGDMLDTYVTSVYEVLALVLQEIASSAITTTSQINLFSWPT